MLKRCKLKATRTEDLDVEQRARSEEPVFLTEVGRQKSDVGRQISDIGSYLCGLHRFGDGRPER